MGRESAGYGADNRKRCAKRRQSKPGALQKETAGSGAERSRRYEDSAGRAVQGGSRKQEKELPQRRIGGS
ncbi:MAG: hypothetical protein NC541_03715 [bacterium]|nr:hypothetical protein [bacterium]